MGTDWNKKVINSHSEEMRHREKRNVAVTTAIPMPRRSAC